MTVKWNGYNATQSYLHRQPGKTLLQKVGKNISILQLIVCYTSFCTYVLRIVKIYFRLNEPYMPACTGIQTVI